MRAETGPMRFGEDWAGVFIRGDNAGAYGMMLREVLNAIEKGEQPNIITVEQLKGLLSDLGGCIESKQLNPDGVQECQELKEFKDCVASSEE